MFRSRTVEICSRKGRQAEEQHLKLGNRWGPFNVADAVVGVGVFILFTA